MITDTASAHVRGARGVAASVLRLVPTSRWWWAVSALAVAAVGAGALSKHTMSKSSFCATCHSVRPYVESWHYSLHRDVACLECHSRSSMRDSLRRLSQARRIKGLMPPADNPVTDAVCTGCHNEQSDLPVMDPCALEADSHPSSCTKCHKDIAHWSRE